MENRYGGDGSFKNQFIAQYKSIQGNRIKITKIKSKPDFHLIS